MKGGHDLGGRQGFGAIAPDLETAEPVFHHEWERRVFALTLAAGMLGRWNIDQSRHARERQHPVAYLKQSYYENWLAGTEKLLLETGLIGEDELNYGAAGKSSVSDPESRLRIPGPAAARGILAGGGPSTGESNTPPKFAVGDEIAVRRKRTPGHTRAPGYAQGCRGRIRARHGAHIFPDANSSGDPVAHHLYSVEFPSSELWGREAEPFAVMIDLWEPYLVPAKTK